MATQEELTTELIELSEQEYAEYLASEVQSRLAMTVEEFKEAYAAGDLDESDAEVSLVASLLWLGDG